MVKCIGDYDTNQMQNQLIASRPWLIHLSLNSVTSFSYFDKAKTQKFNNKPNVEDGNLAMKDWEHLSVAKNVCLLLPH